MIKPTFPTIVRYTGQEIREIRKAFGPKMTQSKFARFFPVSMDTVRSWENNRSTPFGPAGVRLQELKAWVDHISEEKREALKSALSRRKK